MNMKRPNVALWRLSLGVLLSPTVALAQGAPSPSPAPSVTSVSPTAAPKFPFTPPAGWKLIDLSSAATAFMPKIELHWRPVGQHDDSSIEVMSQPTRLTVDQAVKDEQSLMKVASGTTHAPIRTTQCGAEALETQETTAMNGRTIVTTTRSYVLQQRLYRITYMYGRNAGAPAAFLPLLPSMCPGNFETLKPPVNWTDVGKGPQFQYVGMWIDPSEPTDIISTMIATATGGNMRQMARTVAMPAQQIETGQGSITFSAQNATYCGTPGAHTTMKMALNGLTLQMRQALVVRNKTLYGITYMHRAGIPDSPAALAALASLCPPP